MPLNKGVEFTPGVHNGKSGLIDLNEYYKVVPSYTYKSPQLRLRVISTTKQNSQSNELSLVMI